jgi:cobalt/nickel transport system ATP-binding protein
MDNMTRLSIDIESFTYPDGTKALSDIKIDIRKGDFVGILGTNGSGKTTLLKVIDGLIKDFTGNVFLDGDNINKLVPKEIYKKVGLVFQNPDDQLFAPTVFEDIAFGPVNMGLDENEVNTRAAKALKNVEMEGFEKKSINNLSFGQKKRICIAGLLTMGHEILLLDEPTAGLDPRGEQKMMELLTKLSREKGVTIVMTTHMIDLIPLFIDQIYILNKGGLYKGGPAKEVFLESAFLEEIGLRLPYVSQLLEQMKINDGLLLNELPLTIGQARRRLIELMPTNSLINNE